MNSKSPYDFAGKYENAGLAGGNTPTENCNGVVMVLNDGCAICLLHLCHRDNLTASVEAAGRAYPVVKYGGAAIGA